MNTEEWRQKLTELKLRVEEQPANGEAWFELAHFLDRECDSPRQTIAAFEKAQELLPDQDLRLHLGSAHVEAGEYNMGIALLQAHATEKPSAHGCCLLADALMRAERNEAARDALESAIRLDPDFEEAYFLMGELLRDEDDTAALQFYREAVRLDPDYQIAWQRLGSLLIRHKPSLSEGINALKRAAALNSEDAWSFLYLANGLWRAGLIADAQAAYQRAMQLNPDDPFFNKCYREFLVNQGQGHELNGVGSD